MLRYEQTSMKSNFSIVSIDFWRFILFLSECQSCHHIYISYSKNRIKLGKQYDQNQVEKQEYPQVPYDICEHHYDLSQRGENSQEKECFLYEQADNYAHEDPRRKQKGAIDDLKDGVCQASPNVERISPVTKFRKMVNETSLVQLSYFIDRWVYDSYK